MKQLLLVLAVFAKLATGCAQAPDNATTDHSPKIKGRYVLKGAGCAGFEFIGSKKIIWRNEITCFSPDTLAIFWLDQKTFVTKDINKESVSKNCPPRNWIYKVISYDGQNLKVEEFWTGWGEYKPDTLEFTRWISK